MDEPSQINDAAQKIMNKCVLGTPNRVGGEIMFLGEYFASHQIMSYALFDLRSPVDCSLPSLASSRIKVLKYDVLGTTGHLSVKMSRTNASKAQCGPHQIVPPSCQAVLNAMPVTCCWLQKYGPPGGAGVTDPLPWSLEKSDPGKPRNKHAYL